MKLQMRQVGGHRRFPISPAQCGASLKLALVAMIDAHGGDFPRAMRGPH